MAEPDAGILKYEHEKFRPREAEALLLLKTVGHLVKPIMKQRGWKVDVLSQTIFLCLRDFDNEQEFRPLDDIVDTMLHELGHMVHEGHALNFCMLWKQLRDDFKALTVADFKAEEPPLAGIKED